MNLRAVRRDVAWCDIASLKHATTMAARLAESKVAEGPRDWVWVEIVCEAKGCQPVSQMRCCMTSALTSPRSSRRLASRSRHECGSCSKSMDDASFKLGCVITHQQIRA